MNISGKKKKSQRKLYLPEGYLSLSQRKRQRSTPYPYNTTYTHVNLGSEKSLGTADVERSNQGQDWKERDPATPNSRQHSGGILFVGTIADPMNIANIKRIRDNVFASSADSNAGETRSFIKHRDDVTSWNSRHNFTGIYLFDDFVERM
ncbi:hypothetical protein WA026_018011 [Henosepilachna vigintioctopunctata]|uniref:Uncharacterized protein n=1 Tax=Henosepilachna vigintioctopunctata TaxID=420089 RepID=A0AAW1TM34_9CUCU